MAYSVQYRAKRYLLLSSSIKPDAMSSLLPSCPAHPVQHQSSRHSRRPRRRHPPETVARVQRAEHARLRREWQIPEATKRSVLVTRRRIQGLRLTNCFPCLLLQVSIYLPPLKTMKNVVDRMKNLSNFLVGPHFLLMCSFDISCESSVSAERNVGLQL